MDAPLPPPLQPAKGRDVCPHANGQHIGAPPLAADEVLLCLCCLYSNSGWNVDTPYTKRSDLIMHGHVPNQNAI